MELVIRKPSYFEQHYEVDKEILELNKTISEGITNNGISYSSIVNHFDIFPVVVPTELLEQGLGTDDIMFTKSIGRLSVFRNIGFDIYMNASVEERKKLAVKCIIEAAWLAKENRKSTRLNAKKFEKDILEITGYTKDDLGL